MNIVVTVRAIIIHDEKLLVCKHNETGRSFYNLPGGKLDVGETLETGIRRELIEETGVEPTLGHLMVINEFINATNHRIEAIFQITNGADFVNFNAPRASHASEIAEFAFIDPTKDHLDIRPSWLIRDFRKIRDHPELLRAEMMASS